jgi:hypothetical protein
MTHPTTKADLLARMRTGHQEFYDVLARIPEERMDEIALYDTWSIKDFIAHIGWWQNSAAERISAARRGETPQSFDEFETINHEIFERYRYTPLAEVRAMEAESFEAVEKIVQSITDDGELFDAARYPTTNGRQLASYAAGNTFGHYADHLPDVLVWMQKNGLN